MSARTTDRVLSLPTGLDRPTITTRDATRETLGAAMDPFLIASRFDMRGPTFPPHPHAGFAVMTYIMPKSATGFRNQDSTGVSNVIAPGALHVALAGRGLMHEETNVDPSMPALGFQIWIDLPDAHRQDAPSAQHLSADAVPVVVRDGATIRVLAGASNGAASPVALPTAFRLIDVDLAPGATFAQDLSPSETAFAFVVSGAVEMGDDAGHADDVILTRPGGTRLTASAGPKGGRIVLFAGEPLHQRPVMGGPFVARDAEELTGFRRAFAAGRMGRLAAFADRTAA